MTTHACLLSSSSLTVVVEGWFVVAESGFEASGGEPHICLYAVSWFHRYGYIPDCPLGTHHSGGNHFCSYNCKFLGYCHLKLLSWAAFLFSFFLLSLWIRDCMLLIQLYESLSVFLLHILLRGWFLGKHFLTIPKNFLPRFVFTLTSNGGCTMWCSWLLFLFPCPSALGA